MKNNLMELEMLRKLLYKKLHKIETQIEEIKKENTYNVKETRIHGSN
jgi:hypothetical protein